MVVVDANLLVDPGDGSPARPLQVSDLADAVLGSKLDDLLTELAQKLESGQAVALDAATRDALATAAQQDAALSLLATIAANTGTETTTVQQLELTADQVQLNTDQVEALLAHLTDGTAQFKFAAPTSATPANVAASITSVTLAPVNANRRGLYVYNDSTANLFLKLGATASTSSFTVKIPASGLYELPVPFYRGVVDGIWDAANGNARVTELA